MKIAANLGSAAGRAEEAKQIAEAAASIDGPIAELVTRLAKLIEANEIAEIESAGI